MTTTPYNPYEDELRNTEALIEDLQTKQAENYGQEEQHIELEEEQNRRNEIRAKGSHAVLDTKEYGV